MLVFQKLFAAIYLILIRKRRIKFLRHIDRGDTEPFTAVLFVTLAQLYILMFIFYTSRKLMGFDLRFENKDYFLLFKIGIAVFYGIGLYLNSGYFLKDRTRRNLFIDNLRNLDADKRGLWMILGWIIMLLPILVFVIFYTFQ
jgi:hypothetical protein